MNEFSVLIGGKAGFGIDKSGAVIGRLLNRAGYRVYIYRDYPSIIRGGHTFSVIRASINRIAALTSAIDLIIALDQETFDLHKAKLKDNCCVIFDADNIKLDASFMRGLGLPFGAILKEEHAPEIMRNTSMIGAMTKAIRIDFGALEGVLKKEFITETDLNIKIARRGFDAAKEWVRIDSLKQPSLPLLSGNEAIALGLLKGGLDAYISYPMTPTSPILHYLARIAGDVSIDVIHPENEMSVILMALGYSYAGKRAAVGTSGGGFCLMTEGLSFSGMAELPVVIVLGQRPGPSTGLPTYSTQTELYFALHAGHGEFLRFVAAPGDAEEAYYWSAIAMNISWKYQIPAIILSDKNLGESVFNFDMDTVEKAGKEDLLLWDNKLPYKRYVLKDNGVSPLAWPPHKDAVIKVNSYEHDEYGITTEDPGVTKLMQDKRLRKEIFLAEELENMAAVKVYGNKNSETAVLCWGSNKGVCIEAAQKLDLKVIQPIVMSPFPVKQFRESLGGVKRLISVENNATGQLARLLRNYGLNVSGMILKYDGRQFSCDELVAEVRRALQ
jgi:2-oxoglutarate/2-oxoacid ferredoxin oxidoreductase subunit alpha